MRATADNCAHTHAQDELRLLLPAGANVTGPVNTTAAVPPDIFRRCLEQIAADDGVDAILVLTVPTAIADLASVACSADVAKPLVLSVPGQAETARMLPGPPAGPGPVPAYAYPASAARALAHACRYGAWRARKPGRFPEFGDLRDDEARMLIRTFLDRSPEGGWLGPAETADLLACYGITQVTTRLVASEQAAVDVAAQLGVPVVLKADVAGLVHKSDAGAVQLDLHGPDEARAGYRALAERFGARMSAAVIQPMVTGGTEVIIGVVQEPVFGPLVVFGLGGVATDVPGDRSARLADDLPQVAELDLNPVIARPDGAHVVDARMRLLHAQPADPYLRKLS